MSMILLCVFVFENVCCRFLDVLHLFCAAVIFFCFLWVVEPNYITQHPTSFPFTPHFAVR